MLFEPIQSNIYLELLIFISVYLVAGFLWIVLKRK